MSTIAFTRGTSAGSFSKDGGNPVTIFKPKSLIATDDGVILETDTRQYKFLLTDTYTVDSVAYDPATVAALHDKLRDEIFFLNSGGGIGNRVSILGTSISLGSGIHNGTLEYRGASDPLNWAHLLSNGKIFYQKNAGIGGNTSAQILARVQTDIIAPGGTDWCIVEAGINDAAQNIPFATFKSNLIAIHKALKNAGIKVVLCTSVPSGDATAKTLIPLYNQFISYYAYSNQIPLIDFYTKIADPAGTGAQLAAYNLGDGVHPNAAGGKILGQEIVDCLSTVMGNWTPHLAIVQTNSKNLLPNGLNVDTNADGTADSYSKEGTGTASIVADANIIGNWQKLVSAGTASLMYQSATTGFSVGDRLAFSCRIYTGPTSPSKVSVYLTFTTAGAWVSHYLIKDVDVAIDGKKCYYEFTVPEGTLTIRSIIGITAGGTSADVRIAQPTLINLTTQSIN